MKRSGWYIWSVAVWMAAAVCAAASRITGMHSGYALVFFLIMPEWFMVIHTGNREKRELREVLRSASPLCKKISACCLVYAVFRFALGMYLLRDGGPHIHEGIYCLWDHGFVREITESEYKSLLRTEGQMFTGNFLIFATLAMWYFAGREKLNFRNIQDDKEK